MSKAMIIGEAHRSNPTVQIPPPYDMHDDPTANVFSPFSVNHHSNAVSPTSDKYSALEALTALHRYLPSNMNNHSPEVEDYDIPLDAFASDHFRIYEFKVRRCARARSHDWTECPYAHPGEKARRRDPRKVHYSGTACPEFRKGFCVRGDACEHAHGVFECWLHPTRYRTQPCKDGTLCRRKVCFFAHTADQLRLLSPSSPRKGNVFVTESYDGSSSRLGIDSLMRETSFGSSPTSTLYSHPLSPPNESPPMSPCGSLGFNSVSELTESMKSMHMAKASRMSVSPPSWGVQIGFPFWSTRHCSTLRPGMNSVPVTPTREMTQSGLTGFDMRDQSCEEEPAMERVESGRDLRAKMYAKLSKENSLDRVDSPGSGSEFGWVSELVN